MPTIEPTGIHFTPEDIAKFKAAWKQDFGEEITDAEAREMARKLLMLYELIARPLPPDHAPNNNADA